MNLKDRTAWVKEKVSLKALFDHVGISYQDISIPHQIRCPFHGDDIHASARFFPSQNDGSGSFWCWACNDGGDVLWFTQTWYGLDHVVQACTKLEEEFSLTYTQDDITKSFYRAKHKFDEPKDKKGLIESLLLYFEIQACGATYSKDPYTIDQGWLFHLRPLCPPEWREQFFLTEKIMWVEFDELTEKLPKLPYTEAVQVLEEWRSRYKKLLQEFVWQVEKDGDTKQEPLQQQLTAPVLDDESQSTQV